MKERRLIGRKRLGGKKSSVEERMGQRECRGSKEEGKEWRGSKEKGKKMEEIKEGKGI